MHAMHSMRKNILNRLLMISSRADIGGGPLAMLWLMQELKKNAEIEIDVAAPSGQYFSPKLKALCQHYYPLPFRAFSFIKLWQLRQLLKKSPPQIIHTHGRGASTWGLGLKLLLPTKVYWVHTFHGLHYGEGIKERVKFFWDAFAFKRMNKVIALSKGEMQKAHECFGPQRGQLVLIANGIPRDAIQIFRQTYSALESRRLLGLPLEASLAAIMGRADPVKGIEVLWQKVEKLKSNFTWVWAGAKETAQKYQNCFTLSLLAPQADGDLSSWHFFNAIDVFVSHSYREGSPLAVLEAMAFAKKLVLSDIDAHRELAALYPQNVELFDLRADGSKIIELISLSLDKKASQELSLTTNAHVAQSTIKLYQQALQQE